ncbi:hypothetical protein SELMODRAFT_410131 [Selaginella moellendorffii]|nr:hypothetical protein SELMODRAFT_410131 [Selaginella moellendorffii]
MDASHPAVYPVGVPPTAVDPPPRVRMKDYEGMPSTLGGLVLRSGQFACAVTALSIMISIPDFSSVTAFCYLVAAMALQLLWSVSLAVVDGYALLLRRTLHNPVLLSLLVIGDWVTSTLSLAAACSSAGITVLIDSDLAQCAHNHCGR